MLHRINTYTEFVGEGEKGKDEIKAAIRSDFVAEDRIIATPKPLFITGALAAISKSIEDALREQKAPIATLDNFTHVNIRISIEPHKAIFVAEGMSGPAKIGIKGDPSC